MMTFEQSARDELRSELQEKLDSYVQLAEVSKRAIEREKLQLENYEGKIAVLRETLRKMNE